MSAIVARFRALRDSQPDRPLVHRPGLHDSLTANDVWRMHEELGATLRRLDVRTGELVVSGFGNRVESIALLLACRALDIALINADSGAPPAELAALATRFGARLLWSTPDAPGDDAKDAAPNRMRFARGPATETYPDAAVLKLTSGSTGLPKAVFTTEPQLIADSEQIASTMGIKADDVQIAAIPLSHSYGLTCLLAPLLLQATAMVLRESFVPQQLPDDARRFGATRMPGVPFMFDYFLQHPPADGWPASLRGLISAGARLSPETGRHFHDQFGVKIHGFYGTTETGGISFDDTDAVDVGDAVGRPLDGVTLALMQDADTPEGMGRVHVSSPAVARGYVGPDRGDFIADGFLTGDFGTIDDAQRLVLRGRVSSFINVAGRKVPPEEVEAVLRSMAGLADVRVVGAADPKRGQQVVACVVSADKQAPLEPQAVRQYCAARLAAHKIPRVVIVLEAIPLTARGKTDRARLEQLVAAELDRLP